MARIILIVAAIICVSLLYRWIKHQPANRRWQVLMIVVGVGLLGLAASGRLHWLFALAGALIPALQRLPGMLAYLPMMKKVAGAFSGNTPRQGQTSQVETAWLHMQLDHDSGALSGIVKSGRHAGKNLASLSLQELISLYDEYAGLDEDSCRLLENYIDRTHGMDWRADRQGTAQNRQQQQAGSQSDLSEQEAYAILGLAPGADANSVTHAHRRLMQKLHPDRGGSSYLATKINQAKDILLDKAGE